MAKKDYIKCSMSIKADGEVGVIAGYGSVFGNQDSYGDIVVKGAFSESLAKRKPLMLYQHNWEQPLGTFSMVEEDDVGLKFSGNIITETSFGNDAYILAKNQVLTGMSIGGYIEDGEWVHDSFLIKKFDLYEISLVTFPANESARVVAVKSIDEALKGVNDLKSAESYLRDEGFSRREATAFVSHVKGIIQRESGNNEAQKLQALLSERSKIISTLKG